MKELIAYCGLDCEKCDARTATLNDDDRLRKKNAKQWSELNNIEITAEMINCMGCRTDGIKTVYCESLCPIRKCAMSKDFETCGECPSVESCQTAAPVISNNAEAKDNLKKSSIKKHA